MDRRIGVIFNVVAVGISDGHTKPYCAVTVIEERGTQSMVLWCERMETSTNTQIEHSRKRVY